MKKYVQDGTRMRYTAGADIASGEVVLVGTRIGLATANIANGDTGELVMEGVCILPKKSSDNLTQGSICYWDNTAKEITSTSTSNTLAGYVTEAAGASTTTVKVKING